MLASHGADTGLTTRPKNPHSSTENKHSDQKTGKGSEQTFSQEDGQQAHEKMLTPLITREMPATGTVRGHLTPVRTATRQGAASAGEDVETVSSHIAGGCELRQPLW